MNVSPKAGQPVDSSMLVNVPRLVTAYYSLRPDPAVAAEAVSMIVIAKAPRRIDGSPRGLPGMGSDTGSASNAGQRTWTT